MPRKDQFAAPIWKIGLVKSTRSHAPLLPERPMPWCYLKRYAFGANQLWRAFVCCAGPRKTRRGRCLFLALKVLTTRFQSQLLRLLTRRQNRIFHRPEDSCTERGVTPDFRLKTGRIRHACHDDCDAESRKEQLRAPRRANSPPLQKSHRSISMMQLAKRERDAGCLFLSLPSASCCFSLVVGAHRPRGTLICRAREINFPCRLNESKTAWPMACLHSPARGQLINYTHFSPVQAPRDPKCHSPHSLGKNTNEPHISCHHFFHAARNLNWCTVFCFPVS